MCVCVCARRYDLLNGRSACKTQEDGSGQCHISGLQEVPLEIPVEDDDGAQAEGAVTAAMGLLEQGARSRTTAANGTCCMRVCMLCKQATQWGGRETEN